MYEEQAKKVAEEISPKFEGIVKEYDAKKYPNHEYQEFKSRFSALNVNSDLIERALIWKWGHWGKQNFPGSQKQLIKRVSGLWTEFLSSNAKVEANATFSWWTNQEVRYITSAFITHLIHHESNIPIIDQHNFRAMNHFLDMGRVDSQLRHKNKPSSWADIETLKNFTGSVMAYSPGISVEEFDRFLMMYGRNHVPRSFRAERSGPSC